MAKYRINNIVLDSMENPYCNEPITIIESNSPTNALKKFFRLHCMSTGFYEYRKSKITGCAYMVSSYGMQWQAQLIKERK